MGLLDHKELMIVKGVGGAPEDGTSTVEQELIPLNLLAGGFSLEDWSPNIPSLKSGGVWADSSISDGRTLLSGQNTNVTETMVILLTSADSKVFAMQFTALQRMVQDARAFWDTFDQIEPVVLRWWAFGAPGPQFALIYNIDMDVEYDDSTIASARLTLTIERDYRWLPISPGKAAINWSNYVQNRRPSILNYNMTYDVANTRNLLNAAVVNKAEFSSSAYTAFSSQNFIEIDATQIPGDLPALVSLAIQPVVNNDNIVFASRISKPLVQTGVQRSIFLNGCNGTNNVADTTYESDTGGLSGGGYSAPPTAPVRVKIDFSTTTADATRIIWLEIAAKQKVKMNLYRGRYMVFVRARQNAATAGQISMYLRYGRGLPTLVTDAVSPTVQAGTGNTTAWPIHYMGVISLPDYDARSSSSLSDGLGLSKSSDLVFELRASRSAGTAALYVNDIVLIPIDEPTVMLFPIDSANANNYYDNSGFTAHGRLQENAEASSINGTTHEFRSNMPLTLMPGVDNRIYFWSYDQSTLESAVGTTLNVALNIIPCWSGIRDV
jgi:hypothetical protein